ncbi:MAG TPA: hypothetical protein VLT36_16040, partial [Candidatus Dormibacteraeota bacterium]|nr:hypothetical protein [Candidatus Dormibacteraeota bacterium]
MRIEQTAFIQYRSTAMERESRKISWTLWAGVALLLATLILPMLLAQLKIRTSIGAPLEVYGNVA